MILCAGRRKIKIPYQYSREGAERVTARSGCRNRLPPSSAPSRSRLGVGGFRGFSLERAIQKFQKGTHCLKSGEQLAI